LRYIAHRMEEQFEMIAKTAHGFEEILEKELLQLGAQKIEKGVRSVRFVGDKGFMYKANLCLRTAIRILKPVAKVTAQNDNQLYRAMYNFPWETYLNIDQTFYFGVTLNSDYFSHSLFIAQKTKDALVDRFRKLESRRPSVDKDDPDIRFHIHVYQDQFSISIDSSGKSLHQRGYKTATNIAPINEVLAAGMLLLSGWDGQSDFLDPMCGSGTIAIEAAMIACNIPVNINRKEFAFEKWSDWDEALYLTIEESSLHKIRGFDHKIIAYDKAPSAVEKAKENVANANLSDFVEIRQVDFFKTQKESNGFLQLVFNPPYGERLNIEMETFYENIGNTLKRGYPGSHAWFITSNIPALKHVGLRPSRKIHLFNGKLESRFVKYELYEGTKKIHKLRS